MLKVLLDNLGVLIRHKTTWAVVLILAMAYAFWSKDNQVEEYRTYSASLEEKVITVQGDLDKAKAINKANKKASEENQKKLADLEASNKQLSEELKNATSKINSYRNREKVALAKPALVERRANAATQRVFNELSCSSGSTNHCPNEGTKASAPLSSTD